MESRLPVRGRDSRLPGQRFPVSFFFAQDPIGSLGQVSGHCDRRLLVILASPNALVQPQHMGSGQPTLLHDDEISLGGRANPANEGQVKTGQRRMHSGH